MASRSTSFFLHLIQAASRQETTIALPDRHKHHQHHRDIITIIMNIFCATVIISGSSSSSDVCYDSCRQSVGRSFGRRIYCCCRSSTATALADPVGVYSRNGLQLRRRRYGRRKKRMAVGCYVTDCLCTDHYLLLELLYTTATARPITMIIRLINNSSNFIDIYTDIVRRSPKFCFIFADAVGGKRGGGRGRGRRCCCCCC